MLYWGQNMAKVGFIVRQIDTNLSDLRFFTECLDTSFSGLEGIDTLAAAGDLAAAEAQFGRFIREFLNPERYFGAGWNTPYTAEEQAAMPPRGGPDTLPRNFVLDHSARCDNISLPDENTWDVAHRAMKGHIVSCWIEHDFAGPIQWEYDPTGGYGEWTWQLNRHYEWEIFGFCYAHSGDEQYANAFRDQILGFIDQAKEPGDVSGGASLGWRTIEIGIRCAHSWPNAIHSFIRSPSLTDRDWTLIFKSVWENANRLSQRPSGGNWLAMEMNGLAHCGVLYPFFRDAAAWERMAVERIGRQLSEQVYADGFHYELTTNYHQVVIDNAAAVVQVFGKVGRQGPTDLLATLERMYDVYCRIVTPDMDIPNLNDGNRFRMADVMPSAAAQFPHRKDFLYLATERREGEPPSFTNTQMACTGMSVFRSGWEAEDLWCFFEAAPLGFGHQHEDKLNLLLYAYGHEMITEAGRNAYDGSPRHVYALLTGGHNAVLVDGKSQWRRPHFKPDTIRLNASAGMVWHDTADYALAEGVYDEGFGEELLPITHHRRVIYVKHPTYADPYILVIDRLHGDGKPHTYQCLWHYTDHPCTVEGCNVRLHVSDTVTLDTLTSGYETVEIIRGQTEPFWQGWIAEIDVNIHTPIPTAMLSRTATDLRTVTVLAPSKDHPCRIAAVQAGDRVEDTDILLTTADGEIRLCETDFT